MNDTLRKIIFTEVNRNCYNLHEDDNDEQLCQSSKQMIEQNGVTCIEISKRIFNNDSHTHFKVKIHSGEYIIE